MRIGRSFCRPGALLGGLLLLAACAGDGAPPGGVKPALDQVPESQPQRYDRFEREVLVAALRDAAGQTRDAAAVADARVTGSAAPAPRPLLAGPAGPAVAGGAPRPPAVITLEDNLVQAENVVGLAEAVLRDRTELARRAAIADAVANPPPTPAERVTVVAFAPGSAELQRHARRRLELAVVDAAAVTPPPTAWIVRAGASQGAARAEAVRRTLEELGVEAALIETVVADRDVDVAEIAVRR